MEKDFVQTIYYTSGGRKTSDFETYTEVNGRKSSFKLISHTEIAH